MNNNNGFKQFLWKKIHVRSCELKQITHHAKKTCGVTLPPPTYNPSSGQKAKISLKKWKMVANFINQNNSWQNETLDKKRGQKSWGVRSGTNSKQLGHTSDVFWHPYYYRHPSSSEFPTKTNHEKSMSKLTCSISLSSSSLIKCIYIYLTFINPDRIRQNMPASIVRKSSLYHTPSPPSPFPPSPVPPSHHHHQSSASDVISDINFQYLQNISVIFIIIITRAGRRFSGTYLHLFILCKHDVKSVRCCACFFMAI